MHLYVHCHAQAMPEAGLLLPHLANRGAFGELLLCWICTDTCRKVSRASCMLTKPPLSPLNACQEVLTSDNSMWHSAWRNRILSSFYTVLPDCPFRPAGFLLLKLESSRWSHRLEAGGPGRGTMTCSLYPISSNVGEESVLCFMAPLASYSLEESANSLIKFWEALSV